MEIQLSHLLVDAFNVSEGDQDWVESLLAGRFSRGYASGRLPRRGGLASRLWPGTHLVHESARRLRGSKGVLGPLVLTLMHDPDKAASEAYYREADEHPRPCFEREGDEEDSGTEKQHADRAYRLVGI